MKLGFISVCIGIGLLAWGWLVPEPMTMYSLIFLLCTSIIWILPASKASRAIRSIVVYFLLISLSYYMSYGSAGELVRPIIEFFQWLDWINLGPNIQDWTRVLYDLFQIQEPAVNWSPTLFVNLAIFIVYAVLAWPIVILIGIFRYFLPDRGPNSDLGESDRDRKVSLAKRLNQGLGDMLANQVQRFMLYVGAVLTVLIFGYLPLWYYLAGLYLFDQQSILVQQVANSLWIAPTIVLIEFARIAASDISLSRFKKMSLPARQPDQFSLQPLAEGFKKRYRNNSLLLSSPPLVDRHSTSHRQSSPADNSIEIQRIIDHVNRMGEGRLNDFSNLTEEEKEKIRSKGVPGKDFLSLSINETITQSHFHLFAAYLQVALDRGGTAFIICPQPALDAVELGFQQAVHQSALKQTQQWIVLGKNDNAKVDTCDIVVGTVESFEELLASNQREESLVGQFDEELSKLEMVFAINLHDLDTGLFKLMMARLRNVVSHHDTIVFIAQSEPVLHQKDRISQLLRAGQLSLNPSAINSNSLLMLQKGKYATQYWNVWCAGSGVEKDIRNYWKVDIPNLDPAAVLMIEAVSRDTRHNVSLFDPIGWFHSSYWHDSLPAVVSNSNLELKANPADLASFLGNVKPNRLGAPHTDYPVIFVNDTANLADAMFYGIGCGVHGEVSLNVVQRHYPLANFMFDNLGNLQSSNRGEADQAIIGKFHADFGSIAPAPQGGLTELALIIVAELRSSHRSDGISLERVEELFSLYPNVRQIAPQLGISTSKSGLECLFELVLSTKLQLSTTLNRFHEPHYLANNRDELSNAGLKFYSVANAQGEPTTVKLPKSDEGLAFAKGTEFVMDGTAFRVSDITEQNEIRLEECDSSMGENRKNFLFQRHYAFFAKDSNPRNSSIARDKIPTLIEGANPVIILLGQFHVSRKTVATISHLERYRPLVDHCPIPDYVPCDNISAPHRLRSGVLLRIHKNPGSQNKRGRRSNAYGRTELPKIAFTLCTTLQDVLRSMFPHHGHRIAVLSPEAHDAFKVKTPSKRRPKADQNEIEVRKFACRRQPRLTFMRENSDQQELVDPSKLNAANLKNKFGLFGDEAIRTLTEGSQSNAELQLLMDLYIIEDSDHDLGVARAMEEESNRIFDVWSDFLVYCDRKQQDKRFFYRFGSECLPSNFAFEQAKEVVGRLKSRSKNEAT